MADDLAPRVREIDQNGVHQETVLQFGARGYRRCSEVHRRWREAQFVAVVTSSVKHILTELARPASPGDAE